MSDHRVVVAVRVSFSWAETESFLHAAEAGPPTTRQHAARREWEGHETYTIEKRGTSRA